MNFNLISVSIYPSYADNAEKLKKIETEIEQCYNNTIIALNTEKQKLLASLDVIKDQKYLYRKKSYKDYFIHFYLILNQHRIHKF